MGELLTLSHYVCSLGLADMVPITFFSFLIFLRCASAMNALFMLSTNGPSMTTCPTDVVPGQHSLARSAQGLSVGETTYRDQKSDAAAQVLRSWLQQFNQVNTSTASFNGSGPMPTIALASSGGGIRSLLTSAGVVQAFDSRDTNTSVSGLYQALSYHAGHEEGARLVGALSGNNNPTVTQLKALWTLGFRNNQHIPLNQPASALYSKVVLDMTAKNLAGFDVSLVDALGGISSYQMLYATAPDLYSVYQDVYTSTMSGIQNLSNFTSRNVPYPIITAFGIRPENGQYQCYTADLQNHEYEFHPVEFGSWDYGIRAFTDIQYLGSQINNGSPLSRSACTTGFDTLGFVVAASSNVFNFWCSVVPNRYVNSGEGISSFNSEIVGMTNTLHPLTFLDEYGVVPNPFYNFSFAPQVAADQNLYLIGGQQGDRDNPLWPLIQPEREIDVIIVNDNSDQLGGNNLPNGSQLYSTYQRALQFGLSRMPPIPRAETFVSQNLNQNPMTVFGCDIPDKITILYLPNRPVSFPSNQSRFRLTWSQADVLAMIENGGKIGEGVGAQGPEWGSCIACILMKKVSVTPAWCEACFDQWCWRGQDPGAVIVRPL